VAHLVTDKKLAKATVALVLPGTEPGLHSRHEAQTRVRNPAGRLGELYSQAPVRHEKTEPLVPEEVPLFLEAARAPMPSGNQESQDHENASRLCKP